MKDIVTRIVVSLCGIGLVGLMVFLWSQNMVITQPGSEHLNGVSYLLLIGVGIVCAVVLGIYPMSIKRLRMILGVGGVGLIFLGGYVLTNDVAKGLYISDIVRVLGVLILILGATGFLIPETIKKRQKEEKVQVIEV